MAKTSKNKFSIHGDTVTITREEWDRVALATYREDYYDELSTHTWSISNGYPSNSKLGGGLHRYMMAKWYGDDLLKVLTEKDYVVDHMNNNRMDCRISNLEFLKRSRNVAKGMYLDKEAEEMRDRIAVSIFKDFTTECYQITIGCNDHIVSIDENGKKHSIDSIKLLYNCNYSLVVLDAEAILTQYESERRFTLENLRHVDIKINISKYIDLTEEEKNSGLIFRNGQPYLIVGNGQAYLHSINYDAGWLPPKKKLEK